MLYRYALVLMCLPVMACSRPEAGSVNPHAEEMIDVGGTGAAPGKSTQENFGAQDGVVPTPETNAAGTDPNIPSVKTNVAASPWPDQTAPAESHLFGENESEQKLIAQLDDAGKKRVVRINSIRGQLAKKDLKTSDDCVKQRDALDGELSPLVYEMTSQVGAVNDTYDKRLSDLELRTQALRFGECALGTPVTGN